jgi:hypothetical protein
MRSSTAKSTWSASVATSATTPPNSPPEKASPVLFVRAGAAWRGVETLAVALLLPSPPARTSPVLFVRAGAARRGVETLAVALLMRLASPRHPRHHCRGGGGVAWGGDPCGRPSDEACFSTPPPVIIVGAGAAWRGVGTLAVALLLYCPAALLLYGRPTPPRMRSPYSFTCVIALLLLLLVCDRPSPLVCDRPAPARMRSPFSCPAALLPTPLCSMPPPVIIVGAGAAWRGVGTLAVALPLPLPFSCYPNTGKLG